METDLAKRHQTLVILWFALLMSIGMYFLFSLFVAAGGGTEPRNPPNTLLIVVLTALGVVLVLLSFVVKKKLLERSVETQDVNLVQKGLVIACVMCEVSALLGLFEHLVIGHRQYYVLFLVAAAGTASHFPRRNQLEAASYKQK
jgi:hypothetical protein